MLSHLVGKSMIWESPSSAPNLRKSSLIGVLYWWPSMLLFFQLMSGRLKSPVIHIVALLNCEHIEEMVLYSCVAYSSLLLVGR